MYYFPDPTKGLPIIYTFDTFNLSFETELNGPFRASLYAFAAGRAIGDIFCFFVLQFPDCRAGAFLFAVAAIGAFGMVHANPARGDFFA